jgi:hypothetical protein
MTQATPEPSPFDTKGGLSQEASPQPIAALAAGRRLRPPLIGAREAFQKGLGEVATCTVATLCFDDGHDLPSLNFLIVTAGGANVWVGERVTSTDCKLTNALEERGAAAATSIRAGLLGQSSSKDELNG